MKRWIKSIFAIIAIVFLANSQVSFHLGGIDGKSLLKNMSNSSMNLTGTNNDTSNLSTLTPSLQFLGNGGKVPLKDLTSSSLNLSGNNNTTSDLATWGGKPLPPPPPPDFSDFKSAQTIKENRVE